MEVVFRVRVGYGGAWTVGASATATRKIFGRVDRETSRVHGSFARRGGGGGGVGVGPGRLWLRLIADRWPPVYHMVRTYFWG